MIALLISLGVAWASCTPLEPNDYEGPLLARAEALGKVSIEIPLVGSVSAPEALLAVLNERNIKTTLLTTRTWASRHSDFLRNAAEAGHEVGIWFSLKEDLGLTADRSSDPELSDWVAALRASKRTIQRITGTSPNVVGIVYLPLSGEVAIEGMGFRTIYPAERTIDDLPRRARSTSSSAGRARIVGQGPYEDGCGNLLPHWTPASLDRATGAAARGSWVRIGLPPDDVGAPLLARWLDEVVIPYRWQPLTATEISRILRRGPAPIVERAPEVAVSKSISTETWRQASQELVASSTLPRTLVDGLNLTEAFFGLVTLLGHESSPNSVTLGRLDGPSEVAPTGLRDSITLEAEQVRITANQISQRMGGRVPALISVGNQTLTAAEALQLFARVYLGLEAIASPVTDPDPYAPGGGWGTSKGL